MLSTSNTSDIVQKNLTPEDQEFLLGWTTQNHTVLTQLVKHFCLFPCGVEVSVTLKLREIGRGHFEIVFGDVTASREEIRKAFAEHEAQKMKASLAPE
jgi:hypothetical protein